VEKMIERKLFQVELSKLIEQFGEKSFSRRKCDLIYMALRRLDQSELNAVIDDVIGNAKFAPTLDDFKERARKYLLNKAVESSVECSTCKSSGIVSVRKKTGEIGEYAFACTCANGEQYPKFPKWHYTYEKEFTRQIVPIELTRGFYAKK
jgi:hypothetical protein